jgi:hypothetical protein
LSGNVAEALSANQVVGDPPSQWPEGEESQQDRCQDDGTGAAAAGFLILDDAMRSEHDAARFFGDGAVTASLLARKSRKKVRVA